MSHQDKLDLSDYSVISIEDQHKLAIVDFINSVISDQTPLVDLKDVQSVVWRLGRLIVTFEKSFLCGQTLNVPMVITDDNIKDISGTIKSWLNTYYHVDTLIDNLKLEEGNEEEIALSGLLIIHVYYQLRSSLPDAKDHVESAWFILSEFDEQLDSMFRHDKMVSVLQSELEAQRTQRSMEKKKVAKLQKDLVTQKNKLQHSKTLIEKLREKSGGIKPGPKSFKEGKGRGRPKKMLVKEEYESEVEADTPPNPGTPVLLSDSGTGASCRYCGKWFNEGWKLNKHMTLHSGQKPFACDWPGCGRPFDSNYKLQRHRRCHTGERPYPCDMCEKRFTRSDKLKEHQRLHFKKQAKLAAQQALEAQQQEIQMQDGIAQVYQVVEGEMQVLQA